MNITYINSYKNALTSRSAFDDLSPTWKEMLLLRSIMASVLLVLFLLYVGYLLKMGFMGDGVYYPRVSLIVNLCWSIPIAVFFGWVFYKISLGSRSNAIRKAIDVFPSYYFGQTIVSFNSDGVSITAPCYETKYSWKMINSIKTSNDFLFFCLGNYLVFSIPSPALDSPVSEFIAQVENWMTSCQQSLSAETKS